MSKRDDRDDRDEGGPVTPGEQARAEAFGRLVDGLLSGDTLPPAMDSEDRALVETATVVMASSRVIEPAPERTRRLVDQALEAALLRRSGGATSAPIDDASGEHRAASPITLVQPEDPNERSVTDVTTRRRRRGDQMARVLPWAVASLAAAAAIVLFIVRPPDKDRGADQTAEVVQVKEVPLDVMNTSRPADPLIGRIDKADRGKATERIDLLYADRMAGYRDLAFRRALPGEEAPR